MLALGVFALFLLYRRFKGNKVNAQLALLNSEEIQLVDVRTKGEFAGFNASNSLNIPVQALIAGNTEGLDKNKTLIVYCASGVRSSTASAWLKKQGYKVFNAGTVGNVIQHLN